MVSNCNIGIEEDFYYTIISGLENGVKLQLERYKQLSYVYNIRTRKWCQTATNELLVCQGGK